MRLLPIALEDIKAIARWLPRVFDAGHQRNVLKFAGPIANRLRGKQRRDRLSDLVDIDGLHARMQTRLDDRPVHPVT